MHVIRYRAQVQIFISLLLWSPSDIRDGLLMETQLLKGIKRLSIVQDDDAGVVKGYERKEAGPDWTELYAKKWLLAFIDDLAFAKVSHVKDARSVVSANGGKQVSFGIKAYIKDLLIVRDDFPVLVLFVDIPYSASRVKRRAAYELLLHSVPIKAG